MELDEEVSQTRWLGLGGMTCITRNREKNVYHYFPQSFTSHLSLKEATIE